MSSSRPRTVPPGTSGPLTIAATLTLALAGPANASAQEAISYQLHVLSGGDTVTMIVRQGPGLAETRTPGEGEAGRLIFVAGPAVGGYVYEPDSKIGILHAPFSAAVDVTPGVQVETPYGGYAPLDSVRFALERGDRPMTIAGRESAHRVLRADLWWKYRSDDGATTPVHESGSVDFWTAADLPFSWLPWAGTGVGLPEAAPLAFTHPDIAAAALERFSGELRKFGLLLRAEVHDRVEPADDQVLGGTEYERAVWIEDIEAAAAPAPGPWTDWPRLSASRYLVLQSAFLFVQPCADLLPGAGGSYRLETLGPGARETLGKAAWREDADGGDGISLAMGTIGTVLDCTSLLLPDGIDGSGAWAVVPPASLGRPTDGPRAAGVYLVATQQSLDRLLVLDEGTLRLERGDDDHLRGQLEGTGWALERKGDRNVLVEGVRVDASFDAVHGSVSGHAPAPGSTPHAAVGAPVSPSAPSRPPPTRSGG